MSTVLCVCLWSVSVTERAHEPVFAYKRASLAEESHYFAFLVGFVGEQVEHLVDYYLDFLHIF